MEPLVEIKGLSKSFGAIHAVRDVSLSIGSGEIFGIIGFSGAGKSTLVRCINLLERPSSGSVFVAGQDLTALSAKDLRAARKKIGMIFQHFNLLSSKTVADNIAFPMKLAGIYSKTEIRDRVEELLARVSLTDHANKSPSQLSGGQKQRVGIASALACRPTILLCDEATSALDPEVEARIMDRLRGRSMTCLIVAHRLSTIRDCDHILVLDQGRVVEQGSHHDLVALGGLYLDLVRQEAP